MTDIIYCKIWIKLKSMAYILKKTFEILNILTSENYNLSAKYLNLIFKKGFHNLHVVEELCLFLPTIQYLNWFVPEFDSFRKVSFLSIVLCLLDCTSSLSSAKRKSNA